MVTSLISTETEATSVTVSIVKLDGMSCKRLYSDRFRLIIAVNVYCKDKVRLT